MRTRTDAGARARARRIAHHAALCDRFVGWAHGTAVFAAELPDYWDVNVVRCERAAPLTAQELADAAQELQAGLAHRRVEVWDPGTAEGARPGFAALGWDVEVHLWSRLEGASRPAPGGRAVHPVPAGALRPLRARWWGADERFLDQRELADTRLRGELAAFAAVAGDALVAYVTVRLEARTAEVEELFVDPAHRGRGHATALLAEAVAAAGGRELWVVADDGDWPKELYARAGFVGAWRQHLFTRPPR